MKTTLLALIALFMLSCGVDNLEFVDMRIDHYRRPGIGEGFRLFYRAQEGNDVGGTQWKSIDGVEGLDYEWGFIYDLKVLREDIEDPPADGSSVRYVLRELVSKQAAPGNATFELALRYEEPFTVFVMGDIDTGFTILNAVDIDCAAQCEELSQNLAQPVSLRGVFGHANTGIIELLDLKTE